MSYMIQDPEKRAIFFQIIRGILFMGTLINLKYRFQLYTSK